MSDPILLTVLQLVVVLPVSGLLLWWFFARRRQREAAFVETADEAGAVELPVRGTYWHSAVLFGGRSRNSINPKFALLPGGVRIRVIGTTHVRFEETSQIDARKMMMGGTALAFHVERQIFVARFGDATPAKQVLSHVPRSVPLTADAATLRDGDAAAATPGLRPYKGPYR